MEENFDPITQPRQVNSQTEGKSELIYRVDKTKLILPGAILIAALLISGSVVFYSLNGGNIGANIKQAGGSAVAEKINVSADDDAFMGNEKAKQYFKRKISEGKSKSQALVCLRRQMVNIVWMMLKHKTIYRNA